MKPIIKKSIAILISMSILSATYVTAYANETTTAQTTTQQGTQAVTDTSGKAVVTNEKGETVTQSPEAALNQQKTDLEAKLKESEEKLAKYQADQKATEEYINSLDEKIGYMNQDLSVLDNQISAAREKISGLKK